MICHSPLYSGGIPLNVSGRGFSNIQSAQIMFTLILSPSDRQRRQTNKPFSVSAGGVCRTVPYLLVYLMKLVPAIPGQALTSSSRLTNLKMATLNSPFPSSIPSNFSDLFPPIPPLHSLLSPPLLSPPLPSPPLLSPPLPSPPLPPLPSPPSSPLPSPPLPSPPLPSYTHAVHMHYPTTTNGHSHHLPLPCHALCRYN